MGHICTPSGTRPDPKKVKAIEQYPTPKTVRDVRAVIGLAGYYRRHVRNFAEIAKLLTSLTKKETPFDWTQECQQAFQKLKKILSTEPLLVYPNFTQPFIVACDTSTKAVDAVLLQLRDGEERPIIYCSSSNICYETVSLLFVWEEVYSVYRPPSFEMVAELTGSQFPVDTLGYETVRIRFCSRTSSQY